MSYQSTHDNLMLVTLDREGHGRTVGYWYLIQTFPGQAHTAFARRECLLHWLRERNLELTAEMPEHGQHSWQRITGAYRQEAHMSYDEFFALQGTRSKEMSNGDYTLSIITEDADGLRTVHTLNPNCHDRPVFPYMECAHSIIGHY